MMFSKRVILEPTFHGTKCCKTRYGSLLFSQPFAFIVKTTIAVSTRNRFGSRPATLFDRIYRRFEYVLAIITIKCNY